MKILLVTLFIASAMSSDAFIQFKEQMEGHINRFAASILQEFEKFDQTCIQKSYNQCDGTSYLQCYPEFRTEEGCFGQGARLSSKSAIRRQIENSQTLNNQQKYMICMTAKLQTEFQIRRRFFTFNYFGSSTGMIRTYPSIKPQDNQQYTCDNYDPRNRPWYTSSSLAGKKNILFMIDTSNSLNDEELTIKQSAKKYIQTLRNGDNLFLFNIGQSATNLLENKGKFIKVKQNRTQIETIIDGLKIGGITDYKSAFTSALDLIQSQISQKTLCCFDSTTQKTDLVIMFFTDGSSLKNGELQTLFSAYNIRFQMIIIEISATAFERDGLKSLACNSNGVFFKIQNDDTQSVIRKTMQNINTFMAKKQDFSLPVWTEFYNDAWGFGQITTVTKPIYYFNENIGYLVGVAAMDVSESNWFTFLSDKQQILRLLTSSNEYSIKSENCQEYQSLRPSQFQCGCSSNNQNFSSIVFPNIPGENIFAEPETSETSTCCLSVGALVGIIIGSLVILIALIVLTLCLCKYCKNKDNDNQKIPQQSPNNQKSSQAMKLPIPKDFFRKGTSNEN